MNTFATVDCRIRSDTRRPTQDLDLAERFGEDALLIEARAADPGIDEQVLAQMMTTLDRFSDDEIPASAEVVPEIRLFFARWSGELSRD